MSNGATGKFIRDLSAAPSFLLDHAWHSATSTPESFYVTGQQVQDYFDTRYEPLGGGGGGDYVAWNPTTGLATVIAVGSRVLIGDQFTAPSITATDSLIIGQSTCRDLTSGTGIVAIGTGALTSNITGSNNTCMGFQAAQGVGGNSVSSLVCIGYRAGHRLSTGSSNVLIGALSGSILGNGQNNVFIGLETGQTSIGIGGSTFIGRRSGQNSASSASTYIGDHSGFNTTGYGNTSIGSFSLTSTSTDGNVAIGQRALEKQTSGEQNVGIGDYALNENITGSGNVGIGTWALRGQGGSSRSNNIGIGRQSGRLLTTGSTNCLIGSYSGYVLTTGSRNVLIGFEVGRTQISATVNDLLMIHNSDTDTPLIWGDIANNNAGINFNISTASVGTASDGVFYIGNATAVPTGNPVGGGVLYVEAGALKYRGTAGTVTTLGPA